MLGFVAQQVSKHKDILAIFRIAADFHFDAFGSGFS